MSFTPTRSADPVAKPQAVTAVVCLALAAVVAAMASLNVALPSIARSTHATQTQLEWVIDAYSLVFASLLLPAGAIGDRYGRRRSLLFGLSVFGIGSLLAMLASSADFLIVLRAVLGLGAAFVMPATLSTITSTFPVQERARAVGVWAAVAGGSAILGLVTSGALLEIFSWRSVFGVNVVLATLAIIGALRYVPESADADADAESLDSAGALIAVVGLVAIVFSVIEAPGEGWLSARTLGGLLGGLAIMAGFVAWELRARHPILDPRVFGQRRLAAGSISILVQFFAFFGFTFVILQYLQIVRGDSPLLASVSVLPLAATMMPAARSAPVLVARFGPRRICAGGLLLIAVGLCILAQLGTGTSYALMIVGLVALGAGMGAAMTPATAGITEALPAAQQGVGSALNDLSRELGGALGIAVVGSVLNATYRAHLHLPGLPHSLLLRARASFAIAARIGGQASQHAHTAFVTGLHTALLWAAAAALLAALGVLTLLSSRRSPAPRDVRTAAPRI